MARSSSTIVSVNLPLFSSLMPSENVLRSLAQASTLFGSRLASSSAPLTLCSHSFAPWASLPVRAFSAPAFDPSASRKVFQAAAFSSAGASVLRAVARSPTLFAAPSLKIPLRPSMFLSTLYMLRHATACPSCSLFAPSAIASMAAPLLVSPGSPLIAPATSDMFCSIVSVSPAACLRSPMLPVRSSTASLKPSCTVGFMSAASWIMPASTPFSPRVVTRPAIRPSTSPIFFSGVVSSMVGLSSFSSCAIPASTPLSASLPEKPSMSSSIPASVPPMCAFTVGFSSPSRTPMLALTPLFSSLLPKASMSPSMSSRVPLMVSVTVGSSSFTKLPMFAGTSLLVRSPAKVSMSVLMLSSVSPMCSLTGGSSSPARVSTPAFTVLLSSLFSRPSMSLFTPFTAPDMVPSTGGLRSPASSPRPLSI